MLNLTLKEEKILRMAYLQTFGTEAGQIALKDLQARCYKYKTTLDESPYLTAANEGARRILLTIEELMSNEGIERLKRQEGSG